MDDMEMPLRYGDFHRLADDRAGGVQRRRHVRELVEIIEILERPVAALIVEIADIGGPIHRHEDRVLAADRH